MSQLKYRRDISSIPCRQGWESKATVPIGGVNFLKEGGPWPEVQKDRQGQAKFKKRKNSG
jgi:hypothetical protein